MCGHIAINRQQQPVRQADIFERLDRRKAFSLDALKSFADIVENYFKKDRSNT